MFTIMHLISKIFLGEHAPRHTYTSDIHITPLLKILATGLLSVQFSFGNAPLRTEIEAGRMHIDK